jgi:hypothetical protein
MKKMIACAAFSAALLGLAGAAFAADDATAMKPADMATMICRPAATGEKMNAMTATQAPLVCKKIDADRMMSMKKQIEAMPGGEPIWLKMFQEYHIGANGV